MSWLSEKLSEKLSESQDCITALSKIQMSPSAPEGRSSIQVLQKADVKFHDIMQSIISNEFGARPGGSESSI